ncbi:hypothetical protein GCM10025880_10150 [Methylorubrum aminovorans]|nr:hypothetical protein GCM10025880_10150 [Methylorubrum aminovorans]
MAATRLSVVARLLDTAEPGERDGILRAAARSLPTLRIAPWDGAVPPAGQGDEEDEIGRHPLIERLRDGFGRALPVTDLSPAMTGEGRACCRSASPHRPVPDCRRCCPTTFPVRRRRG